MKPLNGTQTHPLTIHSQRVLAQIAKAPIASLLVNPGVRDRLLRENLVEIVQLLSPYKKHKGGTCPHLQITDIGRVRSCL